MEHYLQYKTFQCRYGHNKKTYDGSIFVMKDYVVATHRLTCRSEADLREEFIEFVDRWLAMDGSLTSTRKDLIRSFMVCIPHEETHYWFKVSSPDGWIPQSDCDLVTKKIEEIGAEAVDKVCRIGGTQCGYFVGEGKLKTWVTISFAPLDNHYLVEKVDKEDGQCDY